MRVVCLSAEAADICYRLGCWDQVVAVSAFCPAYLPMKPVVGGFATVDLDKVAAICPDLIITFSDVQAKAAAALIRQGKRVLCLNQRSLDEISEAIRFLGRVLNRSAEGIALADSFDAELDTLRSRPRRRPRVYFEEWHKPMIFGIGWVSEIIHLAGGTDVFAGKSNPRAEERIVPRDQVISANPEIILASWCGKRVDLEEIANRPGFDQVEAVKRRQIFAIDSNNILQAGPALLRGASEIRAIIQAWSRARKTI
jgi:iron complex transport system substrate-binding protein